MVELRTICSITSGQGAPQDNNEYVNGLHTFIKASDLDTIIKDDSEVNSTKITEQAIKKHNYKIFPKNTIIFAKSGQSCKKNRVYLTKEKSCIVNHLCCLYDIDKKYDPKWLKLFIKSFNVTKLIRDDSYPSIALKDISCIQVPEIEITKQREIVVLIDAMNRLLSNKKEQLKQLDEVVKSRFIEMFGDVKNNDKNFFVKKGTDLFKFSSGKFLEATKRLESGIPVYGGNGIAWYTSEPLINFDTIVIGRVGAYCGNVRKISGSNWITDNAIYIKEFKEKCFNLEFLEALMGEYDFAQFNDAAAQPKITQKPMENLYYIVPPIELQNTFAEFVKQVDKSKFIVQKQIDDLQELLDSKMDEYFG